MTPAEQMIALANGLEFALHSLPLPIEKSETAKLHIRNCGVIRDACEDERARDIESGIQRSGVLNDTESAPLCEVKS